MSDAAMPKGCGILAAGLLFFMVGGCQSWTDISRSISGETAQATVDGFWVAQDRGTGEVKEASIKFHFTTPDGIVHSSSVDVPKDYARVAGDTIEVSYLKRDPKFTARPTELGSSNGWILMLLGMALAAGGGYQFFTADKD